MYSNELESVRPHVSAPKRIYDALDLVRGVYAELFPATHASLIIPILAHTALSNDNVLTYLRS
jgi:hypothetical protein